MEKDKSLIKYKEYLLTYGKMVAFENPDKLGIEELESLIVRIFDELNKIDMKLGYEIHDNGLIAPEGVSKERQEELFLSFIDWYNILPTANGQVYRYVIDKFPKDKYPRIICIGDGVNCHLGRKLADEGYQVVSVDPVANTGLSGVNGMSRTGIRKGGSFKAIQSRFDRKSTNMIDWATIIVGSNIPDYADQLIGLRKTTAFSMSKYSQIGEINFKGKQISSSEQLVNEISKCSGVKLSRTKLDSENEQILFIYDPREREDR